MAYGKDWRRTPNFVFSLSVLLTLCFALPSASQSSPLPPHQNSNEHFIFTETKNDPRTSSNDILLTAPSFFLTLHNGRPSFTARPTVNSHFYFDFNFKSIYEIDSQGNKLSSYSLELLNFTANITEEYLHDESVQESKVLLTSILSNNATLKFHFTVVYYEGNSTGQHSTGNITVALRPFLPAAILQLEVFDWPFESSDNSFQIVASLKINVGPLEVGTGSYGQFQVVSVPYYNGLYLSGYIASLLVIDSAPNWTSCRRNFEVTEAAEPVGANVYLTSPYFNKSMSFTSFLQLDETSQGFNATSLITVIGVLIGVFLIAGGAIFLLMRYGGTKDEKPIQAKDEKPSETSPLVVNS